MKTIIELIPLVEKWAEERQIFEKSNSTKQLEKTREEVNELIRDLKTPRDFEMIIDSVGDTAVTLILYSKMKDIDFNSLVEDCKTHFNIKLKLTPRQISKKVDKLMSELTSLEISKGSKKDIILKISEIVDILLHTCKYINKSLEYCLESAYNVISKRKGKIVNGIFVKDE